MNSKLESRWSLIRVFAVALFALGTPLEAYYYWFSFSQKGVPTPVAIMAASTLITLLSVAVYLTKYHWKWWVLAAGVAVFSVHSTSSGQAFAFFSAEARNAGIIREKEYAQKEYGRAEKEVARLDEQYTKMEEELNTTIKTLEDRYKWKNTSGTIEELKRINRAEYEESRGRLAKAKDTLLKTTEQSKTGLYDYYSKMLGGRIGASILQFFDHLYLSILLMLAAPTGVKLWESRAKIDAVVPGKRDKKEKKRSLDFLETEEWKNLPDPAPLRPASRAVGVAHTVLYHAHKNGLLQVVGEPWKVEKEELLRFMKERSHEGQ